MYLFLYIGLRPRRRPREWGHLRRVPAGRGPQRPPRLPEVGHDPRHPLLAADVQVGHRSRGPAPRRYLRGLRRRPGRGRAPGRGGPLARLREQPRPAPPGPHPGRRRAGRRAARAAHRGRPRGAGGRGAGHGQARTGWRPPAGRQAQAARGRLGPAGARPTLPAAWSRAVRVRRRIRVRPALHRR